MEEKKAKNPEVEEEKISEEVMVVEEIPKQEVRIGISEDGKTRFNFVTKEEALTEILKLTREIKKGVSG